MLGSVLGFWNWLYDLYAIKAGVVTVYNRNYSERRGAEAIATQYAPAYFFTFGMCYGVSIRVWEWCLITTGQSSLYWPLYIASMLLVLSCPVAVTALYSLAITGETGIRSYQGVSHEK